MLKEILCLAVVQAGAVRLALAVARHGDVANCEEIAVSAQTICSEIVIP